jgi:predicted RNA-binding Zn-ribbon protein involved in translation (DUF1610 family)
MTDTVTCAQCEQAFDITEPACPACGQLQISTTCARHPDRGADGECVICGSAVCDECDESEAVHYSCPAHRDVAVIEGWAEVYSTSDDMEASLIRDNLQAEGIDAEVLSQKDRSFAVDMGDLSPVRILVPAYEYVDALELISDHMDSAGEVAFACPNCGEAYEGGDRTCRNCGAALA